MSKVYERNNAEELKIGDKVFVADSIKELFRQVENNCGKVFEIKYIDSMEYAYRFTVGTGTVYAFAYLVERAKEKKWRPFKDIQELIDAWKIKTGVTARANTMPLIWVKYNNTPYETAQIMAFDNKNNAICVIDTWYDLTELFDKFTFLDNSPCGEEE